MNQPKVSICIPAYENGEGVERLLTSLCGQSYSNFEVILTDDSKSDVVESVVKSFCKQMNGNAVTEVEDTSDKCITKIDNDALCGKLRYIHNPSPLGPAGNWNKSIDLATGEYIKIMHQDDWFTYDDSLEKFVKMLDENPKAVLAFSGSKQVSANNTYSRHISKEDVAELEKDWRNLYINQSIGAPSATIFRRTDLRFAPELRWLIDSEFYMKLLQKAKASDDAASADIAMTTGAVKMSAVAAHFTYTTEDLVSIGVSDDQMTESVRDDGELNMFEYGFVMNEFELYSEEKYRSKFISQALKLKMPYSKLKEHKIPKEEYIAAKRIYNKELAREYINIIKRKLHK